MAGIILPICESNEACGLPRLGAGVTPAVRERPRWEREAIGTRPVHNQYPPDPNERVAPGRRGGGHSPWFWVPNAKRTSGAVCGLGKKKGVVL